MKVLSFSPKGGRVKKGSERLNPVGKNAQKVALSILFFHSLFAVNFFATFGHVVGKP